MTTTATINVQKATPVLTWANPAAITYGTALGATQLDATSTVAGQLRLHAGRGHRAVGAGSQTLTLHVHTYRHHRLRHCNRRPLSSDCQQGPTLTVAAEQCKSGPTAVPRIRPLPTPSPASSTAMRPAWCSAQLRASRTTATLTSSLPVLTRLPSTSRHAVGSQLHVRFGRTGRLTITHGHADHHLGQLPPRSHTARR